MTGPGIKQDERVYGANLIDITPTILAYLDLPIGADMKGRPLLNVFAEPKEIETIPSWDEKEGDHGMHPPGTQLEAKQADELRQQFVALGYVDDHGKDLEKGYKSASTEQKYNLAQVYLGTSRPQLAKPLLEELLNEFPWEVRFIKRLAFAYFRCGFYTQCINLLEKAYPRFETLPIKLNLLKGRCFLELGRIDEALVDFEQVRKKYLKYPQLYIQLGAATCNKICPTGQKNHSKRLWSFPQNQRLPGKDSRRTHLKLRNNETAADAALNAVGLMHHLPQSHYSLGVALARLKDYERAPWRSSRLCTSVRMLSTHIAGSINCTASICMILTRRRCTNASASKLLGRFVGSGMNRSFAPPRHLIFLRWPIERCAAKS